MSLSRVWRTDEAEVIPSGTSIDITLPTSSSAGTRGSGNLDIQAGDAIVAVAFQRSGAASLTVPSGFAIHGTGTSLDPATDQWVSIATKIADGTEDGSTLTFSQSSSGRMAVIVAVYRSTTGSCAFSNAVVNDETDMDVQDAKTGTLTMTAITETEPFVAVAAATNVYAATNTVSASPDVQPGSGVEWSLVNTGGVSTNRERLAMAEGFFNNESTSALIWGPFTDGSAVINYTQVLSAVMVSIVESGGGTSAVSFSGTVPTQNLTEDAAVSTLDLSTYFSGTETPFTYAVQTGSLPAGLSLDSSTGEITGTPTATGTFSIVVRATDVASDTADTNSFDIVVAAAVTEVKGIQISLKEADGATAAASLTGLYYHAWDALNPGGASDANGSAETTDASGVLEIDIDSFSASVGGEVFLFVYSLDGTEDKDSVCFAGRVPVVDIS